jgi:DNA-binding transcriptional LysR family regulator
MNTLSFPSPRVQINRNLFQKIQVRENPSLVWTPNREHRRVVVLNTWRVTDPRAQHALIRTGIGWGSLPEAAAAEDLASGRLVRLGCERRSPFGASPRLSIIVAHRREEPLGPAGLGCLIGSVP